MIGLWDTTGNAVVKALAEERRTAGGVTSGLALTLVVVVDEPGVRA
ncbi:MAG: glucose-6-phosphate dehydrogenase, partial [Dactylosporangium sp.]|nr:glucose-6-phosphate dehydrogenase [Dactylosporangium sp.]NNJ63354.1 glucose-6-phosphate dehydrogenase [Dactylosporangium sp.]